MDYRALSQQGDTLLKQFGAYVTIKRNGQNVGRAWGVFTSKNAADESSTASSIRAQSTRTTRTLLLSGQSKPPAVGDTVTQGSESWQITAVDSIRPADITVLYKLEVV